MKKVLFFFPHNPEHKNSGSKMRALALLDYFSERQFDIDFVGLKSWDDWEIKSPDGFLNSNVSNVYLFKEKPEKGNIVRRLFEYKIPSMQFKRHNKVPSGSIHDYTTYYLKKSFEKLLIQKQYDYIIVSYVYWATLIKDNPHIGFTKTIIDTHDFLTSQHQNDSDLQIGVSFADELSRLNLFDEIWTISTDEHYLFSQFLGAKVKYLPMSFEGGTENPVPHEAQEYDLIYVASDNDNNIRSVRWLFEEVYPNLQESIKICIIGKITSHIPDFANVTKIPFMSDLSSMYKTSKIALCPMLAGTGLKIKVIEALSFGLPVVCTTRGLDGLPNKVNNGCLASDDPLVFAHNIELLIKDQNEYLKHHRQGVDLFRSTFSKLSCYATLDKLFN